MPAIFNYIWDSSRVENQICKNLDGHQRGATPQTLLPPRTSPDFYSPESAALVQVWPKRRVLLCVAQGYRQSICLLAKWLQAQHVVIVQDRQQPAYGQHKSIIQLPTKLAGSSGFLPFLLYPVHMWYHITSQKGCVVLPGQRVTGWGKRSECVETIFVKATSTPLFYLSRFASLQFSPEKEPGEKKVAVQPPPP